MEVNISHGKRLQELVPKKLQTKPWWVPNRGHNDILMDNLYEFYTLVNY